VLKTGDEKLNGHLSAEGRRKRTRKSTRTRTRTSAENERCETEWKFEC
jgi:hypothetical protein